MPLPWPNADKSVGLLQYLDNLPSVPLSYFLIIMQAGHSALAYFEDGTMVVVNGGGDYINSTIEARVLSVKHTSSGRMIFCNVAKEGEEDEYPTDEPMDDENQ